VMQYLEQSQQTGRIPCVFPEFRRDSNGELVPDFFLYGVHDTRSTHESSQDLDPALRQQRLDAELDAHMFGHLTQVSILTLVEVRCLP
jgi:hypothetical protein